MSHSKGVSAKRLVRRASILSRLVGNIALARITRRRRPIFMGLYITNTCNLRCEYCFANVDNRFDDPLRAGFTGDEVVDIVDELYRMGTRWIFLLGGEPLAHKEIGRIVKHIADKGILLHVITNGSLIERHIDAIEPADGVCVSVDGLEEATDAMRGKGAFKKAMGGVQAALSRGMTVRVHAVLNKHSIGDMEQLAKLVRDAGASLTFSPPNYLSNGDYLGSGDNPALQLSGEDYREFYTRYKDLKLRGYPINNSVYSIDKALHWPVPYHKYIEEGQTFEDYEPIRCVISDLHGCIDAEGTMFNCIQLGCLNGPNIHDVGIEKAWEDLPQFRPNCVSCSSVNTIEVAAYMTLRKEIVGQGFKFFFGSRNR